MKCIMVILTVLLAMAATVSAAAVPQVARQLPPCQPPARQPPTQPWTPQATIAVDEGVATATLGSLSCTLTEELPEGQFLPPSAVVQQFWGGQRVVVRAYPSQQSYSCQLQAGEGDRR